MKPTASKQAKELGLKPLTNPNKLTDYIASNYSGSQAAFARAQGVKPQQVTEWINKKFIVVDHVLYSPRRELKPCQK